jgi:hypothetical protein
MFTDSTGVQWRVLAEDSAGNKLIITEHVHGLVRRITDVSDNLQGVAQYNSTNSYTRLSESKELRPALNKWFADTLAPELKEVALPVESVDNDVRLEPGGFVDIHEAYRLMAGENEPAGLTSAGVGDATPGNSLFVLSISEVNEYVRLGTLNIQGMALVYWSDLDDHYVRASWWLRSPGYSTAYPVAIVGAGDTSGARLSIASATEIHGFRPALWVRRAGE